MNPYFPNRDNPEAKPSPVQRVTTVLTPAQYKALEDKFPIDGRGDNPAFQLGVQAVLRELRRGLTSA